MRASCLAGGFLLVAGFVACKKNPAPPTPTPPSTAEVDTFAKVYTSAKAPCDVVKMQELVDIDLILARAVEGTDASRDMVKGMRRGLKPGELLCGTALGDHISIRHLRTKTVDGSPRPLFRLIGDRGFTYEILELDKRDTGVVAADILNYASGVKYSTMFRNLIATLDENTGGSTKLIQQMNHHRTEGKFTEAYADFQTLPENIRKSRELMVLEVQIAMNLDEATSIDALDRFTKAFPDDPSLLITEIGLHMVHKHFDKMLAAIAKLDADLGGDPYLDIVRADAYEALGKRDEAITAAKRATVAEPTLVEAWWQLLAQQARANRFADATATLTVLRDKHAAKVDGATLAQDERFKALVASTEFAAWAKP